MDLRMEVVEEQSVTPVTEKTLITEVLELQQAIQHTLKMTLMTLKGRISHAMIVMIPLYFPISSQEQITMETANTTFPRPMSVIPVTALEEALTDLSHKEPQLVLRLLGSTGFTKVMAPSLQERKSGVQDVTMMYHQSLILIQPRISVVIIRRMVTTLVHMAK